MASNAQTRREFWRTHLSPTRTLFAKPCSFVFAVMIWARNFGVFRVEGTLAHDRTTGLYTVVVLMLNSKAPCTTRLDADLLANTWQTHRAHAGTTTLHAAVSSRRASPGRFRWGQSRRFQSIVLVLLRAGVAPWCSAGRTKCQTYTLMVRRSWFFCCVVAYLIVVWMFG